MSRRPCRACQASSFDKLTKLILGGVLAVALQFAVVPVVWGESLRRTPIVEAVAKVRPSVVNIHSERTVHLRNRNPVALDGAVQRVNGMGTGVIVDERGYIVTNDHVVDGVQSLRASLADGSTYDCKVITRDSKGDLALLKIEAGRSLPTAPLGTAQDLMIGETVLAIGNAFGYEHTVTTGVISALHRSVEIASDQTYENLIQTDASINPGNSGGPLVNINGEVIAINVAIRAGAQNIGFAIPIDRVKQITAELLSIRRLKHTWHGFVCRECDPSGKQAGLVIEQLEARSPAAKGGFEQGDVIVQVAGTPVRNSLDLERLLLDSRPGDPVPVVVQRKDAEKSLALVLEPAPAVAASGPAAVIWSRLGLRVSALDRRQSQQLGTSYRGGLNVVDVDPAGPAGRQGIRSGDLLVGLHTWETINVDNVIYALTNANSNSMSFYILRGGVTRYGQITPVGSSR